MAKILELFSQKGPKNNGRGRTPDTILPPTAMVRGDGLSGVVKKQETFLGTPFPDDAALIMHLRTIVDGEVNDLELIEGTHGVQLGGRIYGFNQPNTSLEAIMEKIAADTEDSEHYARTQVKAMGTKVDPDELIDEIAGSYRRQERKQFKSWKEIAWGHSGEFNRLGSDIESGGLVDILTKAQGTARDSAKRLMPAPGYLPTNIVAPIAVMNTFGSFATCLGVELRSMYAFNPQAGGETRILPVSTLQLFTEMAIVTDNYLEHHQQNTSTTRSVFPVARQLK